MTGKRTASCECCGELYIYIIAGVCKSCGHQQGQPVRVFAGAL